MNMPSSFPDQVRKSTNAVMAFSDGGDVGKGFTVLDRKVFNALLGNAYKRLPYALTFRASLSELAMVVGHDPDRKQRLIESLDKLATEDIAIEWTDQNNNWHKVRCHYLSYIASSIGDGVIEYAFDPIMLEFIKDPEVYAKIRLSTSAKFKTPAGLKLYEIMSMHYCRRNKEWKPTIAELRRCFEIKDDEHLRFDHFRSRVVEPAVAEICRNAEFFVTVNYLKSGRGGKVTHVRFMASSKQPGDLGRILEPSNRGGVRPKDLHTVDMFYGSTEDEMRVVGPTISSHVMVEVDELIGPEQSAEEWREEWIKEFGPKAHHNPDSSFLAWVELKHAKLKGGDEMAALDVQSFFDNLLNEG